MKNIAGLPLFFFLIVATHSFAQHTDSEAPKATADEAALPFRDIPNLEEPYTNAAPIERNDGIRVGKLKLFKLKLVQTVIITMYQNS